MRTRERDREKGKGKRNRIKKETGRRRVGTSEEKENKKEMKITCSTNVLTGSTLDLKSDCKFKRILAMDTEKNGKSHIHVNISRNENAEVKSISKETQDVSRSGELRVWFIECFTAVLFRLFQSLREFLTNLFAASHTRTIVILPLIYIVDSVLETPGILSLSSANTGKKWNTGNYEGNAY